MKNIPKNLFTYLLDRGDCLDKIQSNKFIRSVTGKPVIITDFIDYRYSGRKRYSNNLKRYQAIKFSRSICVYNNEDRVYPSDSFVGFKLPNSEFKLRLNTSFSNYSHALLELVSKHFDDLLYQPAICINFSSFIKLLNSCGGCLENGMIPGNYKLGIVSLGTYSVYDLVNEDFHDVRETLSILVGESILNKKTRDLLPGHFYCFDNRDIFLCLGKISNIDGYSRKYYKKDPVSIFINNQSLSNLSHIEDGYLIVPLVYTDISVLSQLVNLTNKEIDIQELVNYLLSISISNRNNYGFNKLLSVIEKSNCLAIDLNISIDIVDYSIDLKKLLKDCILETINSLDDLVRDGIYKAQSFLSLYLFISDLVDDVKLRKAFVYYSIDLCKDKLTRTTLIFKKDKAFFVNFISNYNGSSPSFKDTYLSFYDKDLVNFIRLLKTEYKLTEVELNYIIYKTYA